MLSEKDIFMKEALLCPQEVGVGEDRGFHQAKDFLVREDLQDFSSSLWKTCKDLVREL